MSSVVKEPRPPSNSRNRKQSRTVFASPPESPRSASPSSLVEFLRQRSLEAVEGQLRDIGVEQVTDLDFLQDDDLREEAGLKRTSLSFVRKKQHPSFPAAQ